MTKKITSKANGGEGERDFNLHFKWVYFISNILQQAPGLPQGTKVRTCSINFENEAKSMTNSTSKKRALLACQHGSKIKEERSHIMEDQACVIIVTLCSEK